MRFAIISCILISQINFAQDDPNLDNTFGMTRPTVNPELLEREVLTSEDGFDNFFLGVDFAEPHMSENPNAPTEYFNSFNASTNIAHYTNDGHDWVTTVPVFGVPERGDPVTAYDSLGNLYYELMYGSGSILGCKVIRSTDNGATWTPAVTSVAGIDKNWIAADQTSGPYANYVYTTMTAGGGVGRFARSTDFGATWQTTFTPNTQSLPGMMVAVGPDVSGPDVPGGAVYVVTNSGSAFFAAYTFYVSNNGGATFTLKSVQHFANYVGQNVNGRNSVENMRTRPYPFITADNSYGQYRGRLYVIYASNNPSGNGNKPDIYCRYSDNQGVTWSSAVTINDDQNSVNHHQWMPATWCDKETGRLYVKWFDTRNVPTSDSAEVYASYSDDGGDTWVTNQNLSTAKFKIDCNTCGGGGTPRYQGDYDAITSNGITSMSVWSDFRNGAFGSYVAYFPDFAMTISADADTIQPTDILDIIVKVPAVKLYSNSVKFSATVSPQANFIFSFPQGDSLNAYPDSVTLRINPNNVPSDTYTITVSGIGPNGTPVHRREITLLVTTPVTTVVQPNGGDELFVGTSYPIRWEKIFVDSVKLEYSTDGGSTWNLITDGVYKRTRSFTHPKYSVNESDELLVTFNQYDWVVPNTISNDCLVRVSDKSDPAVFDVSDSPFSIVSSPLPNWRLQTSAMDSTILCVDIVDTSFAWAGGTDGKVLRTTNGGNTWTVVSSALGGDVNSISAINDQRAIVAVNTPEGSKIRRTLTNGIVWGTVYEDTTNGSFINSVIMFDDDNGYAIGDPVNGQWKLLRTTNGGTNWNSAATLLQNGSETGWTNSMDWIGSQYGWIGTDNDRIYRTTDGGSSWTASSTTFGNSMAVSFIDELNGIAGGDGTDRTTDGGVTWSTSPAQVPGTAFGSASVNLPPGRWYFISGNEVYKTFDQGNSFNLEYSQANVYQHIAMEVVRVGVNDWICGYAVGDNGTITKYIEVYTITDVKTSTGLLPNEYSLMQNYPNPFNPNTVIEYSIPQSGFVTLEIYNLLGEKVASLVNGMQEAGRYEINFDASNFASGIYFYNLKSGSFNSVKKMLLMK
jgi:photosystem II stability/assembly factor-like uncharacterized protein